MPDFGVKVLPSFRPDKGLELRRPTFGPWIRKLEEAAGMPVTSYGLLLILGRLYADRGWAMQYHMNASRNNEAPDDFELLGGMVRNIGYFNAKHYFAFDRQKDGSERVAL
ncbi:glucuronate isomerase [uncultured Paenibacillus sp.]|uniref:glucuronate isomerase n=1 Tax=uncultured Paenibacillus sp. TaxID=227322 RepID=UPI0037DD493A